MVSVSHTNQYAHVIIERGLDYPASLQKKDKLIIKRAPDRPVVLGLMHKLKRKICAHFRKKFVNAKLRKAGYLE
jgi:hypothetical protein